jgi:RNA polymerase sigma factor (sigma-70 family)
MSNSMKTITREQALAQAVEEHERNLRSAIGRRIRDEVEAEDIAQEVFEEFLQAYDLNEVIDSLGAWLFTVARNKIFDRFRKKKTETGYRENFLRQENEMDYSLSSPPEAARIAADQRGEILAALANFWLSSAMFSSCMN